MSLEKFINNPEFSWIFEVDQIEGDDPSFYENSLEQELEIDLHQSLNRLIAIVFGPVLPYLICSSIINSNDSALSLESSESFKKFSDKNEMALIKENPDFFYSGRKPYKSIKFFIYSDQQFDRQQTS